MLVSLREVLSDAKAKKYAVGLFNTVNLEMAQGVLSAAEELASPVIIGTAEVLLPYAGLSELAPLLLAMAKAAKVPVVLHFDHGLTRQLIEKAVSLGFNSVMYDCSVLEYLNNLTEVSHLVECMRGKGVCVEAELGHVGSGDVGSLESSGEEDRSVYTDPSLAHEFAVMSGIDALAVAIGTVHGPYLKKPKLDLDRLSEISGAVEVPLVLHGGSGLSDEDFKSCIAAGISKINIFTDINLAAARAVAQNYERGFGMTDLMESIKRAVFDETVRKMTVFGSAGRY